MRHHTTVRITRRRLGAIGAGAALVLAIAPWAQAAHADTSPATGPTASATPSASSTPTAGQSTVPATSVATSADAVPSAATPHPRAKTGNAAAGGAYLVTQLTGGDHVESSYTDSTGKVQTFVDYGGTADVAIALASTGTQDATLAKVVGYLDAHVADYADPSGALGGPFDGAAGKLALLNEIVGQDPHKVGGTDLIALLTSNVCTAATADGACSAAGDFHGAYSGLGQALPILALARAQATVPPTALARLAELQCTDGGFSSDLIAPGAACTSDVDTTGAALQALVLVPSESAVAKRAALFLAAQQQPDGGFTGAAGENANSTALAVQALIASAGNPSAIANGQTFLASLQQADGGLKVSSTSSGSDLRATDQAVPAIAGTTLTTLSHPISTTPAPTTSATPTLTPAAPTSASAAAIAVATADGGTTATGALPYTGWDAGVWAQLAAALLLIGCALTAVGRRLRRRSQPTS